MTSSLKLGGSLICASGTGLNLAVDNITIDLNGYTIQTAETFTSPINALGRSGITIKNGTLRAAPEADGLRIGDVSPGSATISNVTLIGQAPTGAGIGIDCSRESRVSVQNTSVSGFSLGMAVRPGCSASISSSTFNQNTYTGLSLQGLTHSVNRVTASYNGGTGVLVQVFPSLSSTLLNVVADHNGMKGIDLLLSNPSYLVLSGGYARYNGSHGVMLTGGTAVRNGSSITKVMSLGNVEDGFNLADPGAMLFKSNTANSNLGSGVWMTVGGLSGGFVGSGNTANRNAEYGFGADGSVSGSGNSAAGNTINCLGWVCR